MATSHHDLIRRLVQMQPAEFVEVMRLTFDARADDLDQQHSSSRYVLATVTVTQQERAVEFVAYPRDVPLTGEGLWEGGLCSVCDYEARSTSKPARCGVCSSELELT